MDRSEKLDALVRGFADESGHDIDDIGRTDEEKWNTLRSLMNVRMPAPLDESLLELQDSYLHEINSERRVDIDDIPTIHEQYGASGFHSDVISIWQGDITMLAADAIVNAANSGMLGCFRPLHACIDNCIHTYAGVQLRLDCAERMDLLREKFGDDWEYPTAEPMVTPAFNLPSKYVIHIVGPIVFRELTKKNEEDLRNCYLRSLETSVKMGIKSIAFCCISTGVFRFPNRRAAEIAVDAVIQWLDLHPNSMDRIVFNVFTDKDLGIYEELLGKS